MAVSNAEMLALARKLPIPVPWDRNVFIENLARERGRPIQLIPTDVTAIFADVPCGVWLTRDHDDVILHEAGTTDYHIDQIVSHEIGHMVLGHTGVPQFDNNQDRQSELLRTILPDLDPASVHAILGRTNYATDQERDAEMFANMLMIAAVEAGSRQSMMDTFFSAGGAWGR
ncbi:MAG: hypothetical protein CK429_06885 [Mycobacterium sp.]|nr:MAG: hypothetical protein CK429_06885 [Mycobacterium sp.]